MAIEWLSLADLAGAPQLRIARATDVVHVGTNTLTNTSVGSGGDHEGAWAFIVTFFERSGTGTVLGGAAGDTPQAGTGNIHPSTITVRNWTTSAPAYATATGAGGWIDFGYARGGYRNRNYLSIWGKVVTQDDIIDDSTGFRAEIVHSTSITVQDNATVTSRLFVVLGAKTDTTTQVSVGNIARAFMNEVPETTTGNVGSTADSPDKIVFPKGTAHADYDADFLGSSFMSIWAGATPRNSANIALGGTSSSSTTNTSTAGNGPEPSVTGSMTAQDGGSNPGPSASTYSGGLTCPAPNDTVSPTDDYSLWYPFPLPSSVQGSSTTHGGFVNNNASSMSSVLFFKNFTAFTDFDDPWDTSTEAYAFDVATDTLYGSVSGVVLLPEAVAGGTTRVVSGAISTGTVSATAVVSSTATTQTVSGAVSTGTVSASATVTAVGTSTLTPSASVGTVATSATATANTGTSVLTPAVAVGTVSATAAVSATTGTSTLSPAATIGAVGASATVSSATDTSAVSASVAVGTISATADVTDIPTVSGSAAVGTVSATAVVSSVTGTSVISGTLSAGALSATATASSSTTTVTATGAATLAISASAPVVKQTPTAVASGAISIGSIGSSATPETTSAVSVTGAISVGAVSGTASVSSPRHSKQLSAAASVGTFSSTASVNSVSAGEIVGSVSVGALSATVTASSTTTTVAIGAAIAVGAVGATATVTAVTGSSTVVAQVSFGLSASSTATSSTPTAVVAGAVGISISAAGSVSLSSSGTVEGTISIGLIGGSASVLTATVTSLEVTIDGVGDLAHNLLKRSEIVSVEEIWNIGLTQLGVGRVASADNDNSAQAALLRDVWDNFRQQFISDHAWNGCKTTAALTALPDSDFKDTTRWGNIFSLPSDYIRALTVNGYKNQPDNSETVMWEIEAVANSSGTKSRCLCTNQSSAKLEYVFDVGDTSTDLLSPAMKHAMGLALGAFVAPNFGKSANEITLMEQKVKEALLKAKGVDGQENSARYFSPSSLIESRYRSL